MARRQCSSIDRDNLELQSTTLHENDALNEEMKPTVSAADFLLEPDVIFLNHGSFGACPRVVHDQYQKLQRQLESQPVRFLQRELPDLLNDARAQLAQFLGGRPQDLVFVPNPTFATNEIARSLQLEPGDEVLTSNHEYGSCLNAWQFMAQRRGFQIVQQPIDLPVQQEQQIADDFWDAVSERTKVIFLSHISSPTALTFPVAEICRRARQRGILTVIDGAHAPGQRSVDLQAIDADFYMGTCHKWLGAPKGSAFLHAQSAVQSLIEPLIVGWGWGEANRQFESGSDFLDYHQWLGTHDPSAYLTVPAAIQFQKDNDWKSVRTRCHQLAVELIDQAETIPGVGRVHPNEMFQQMALLSIDPAHFDPQTLKSRLLGHGIEVPVIEWNGRWFVRVSLQAYNTRTEIAAFLEALQRIRIGTV
ncbi:Isopenicillin N epimerase [Stieleria bergensis]|uniref:Isopenicillin N epimerase n=1 Tax=Stieleria bergensis TaxID=2528025 RepID=A0A517SUQ4_9BACT|nr:Isopenicillin N epimerase [Planctomycetes bacterium SV_7m_r]